MKRDPIWIEIAIYATAITLFAVLYVVLMKYAIPYYYCHYYYVCL